MDEFDVVVVGSGAAGLVCALVAAASGLDVLVLEKASRFGGTSAVSGGWLWIPMSPQAVAAGIDDSPRAVHDYLRAAAGAHYNEHRVQAFLDAGPAMVGFLEKNTLLRFELGRGFPDYHPTLPGGRAGGRSIVPTALEGQVLGEAINDLVPPLRELTLFGMVISGGSEVKKFLNVTRSMSAFFFVLRKMLAHAVDVLRFGRGMRLVNGNALVAGLAKALKDRGVPIWLSSPAVSLIEEAGAVRGVVANRQGVLTRISARRGVVLASGGFPHDVKRRQELFPHHPVEADHWSLAAKTNQGDGLRMAEQQGAAFCSLPNAAAWAPVSHVSYRDGTHGLYPHFVDRGKPGIIAVRADGQRFVNEGDSYHDFGKALYAATPEGEPVKAFFICDHPTLRRYGLGVARPFPLPVASHIRSGYLVRADTIAELARQLGIDEANLTETVARFNRIAAEGKDPDFGRGDNVYNKFQGDATRDDHSLAPIVQAPFYGVRIVAGSLGTYSGLVTDANAQVVNGNGKSIPGLYAVGNDMASIMGGDYPAGGSTLGPGMAFGYIAANHLRQSNPTAIN